MKRRYLALFCLMTAAGYAQEEGPSNLTFDVDFYAVEPKYTLSIGARSLSGAKANFSGAGSVESTNLPGDATVHGTLRQYHDGATGTDGRTIKVDDGNGGTISVPITADGLSDNWRFNDIRQVQTDGSIAMHTYKADIIDAGRREKDPTGSYGIELAFRRDLKGIMTRFNWQLVGGVSLNTISSHVTSQEAANITTLTDIYSLAGAPPPSAPYTSHGTRQEIIYDSAGNPVLDANGGNSTRTVSNTVLIADTPLTRDTTLTTSSTSITNHFLLKGAYYTFRAGPTMIFPIVGNLRATLSLGAALVFAGTDYEVEQDYITDTGDPLQSIVVDQETKLLPGYFVDATLDYALTQRAGFYAGASYQSTGKYTQKIETATANYQSTIDLSSLHGFSFGMNVRF